MANVRKSLDGRKRARTMEYIDSQVDINDVESNLHIGEHIHAQFDLSVSMIDENPNEKSNSSVRPLLKRMSERSFLSRQMSDMTLNRLMNDTGKTTTEFKGRDHVRRVMKTTNQKPMMDLKNHKFIQDMIVKRQEKQQINRPLTDFAHQYGLMDDHGKRTKNRVTSELITDMTSQLESLKPTLTKRSIIDPQSPLLKVVKLEHSYNHLLCYCQLVTDEADVVVFLDPKDEQFKDLAVNKHIQIGGDSRLQLNLPELGSVTLGVTDLRNECVSNEGEVQMSEDIIRNFDFQCSCEKCNDNELDHVSVRDFDLRSTFPDSDSRQITDRSIEPVYDSFTLALMSKRKFDLRASIIIYNPDKINHRYIFIVRDGVGNCLEIILNDIEGLPIEIQSRNYIFHQIEFLERIDEPRESHRWPYDDYVSPKKLFCFRSTHNQVSLL